MRCVRACAYFVRMSERDLILMFGTDDYLVRRHARELLDKWLPGKDAVLKLDTFDGAVTTSAAALAAIDGCMAAIATLGFFSTEKVIWLRDVAFFMETPVGRSEAVKQKLRDLGTILARGLPAGVRMLVTARKVHKLSAFYKTCQKHGSVHEYSIPERPRDAERYAQQAVSGLAKSAGVAMTADAGAALVARVGTDTGCLAGEIEKLTLYVADRKTITVKDVRAAASTSGEADIWELADALGNRDLPTCLQLLRKLLSQKTGAPGILRILEMKIRELLVFRACSDRKWLGGHERGAVWSEVPAEVDALFGQMYKRDPRATHPYRAGIVAGQAMKFTPRALWRCQELLVSAHEALVSRSLPEGTVLELLLVEALT